MTSPVPREALAAALAAVPFVNQDACRRILEAAAPVAGAAVSGPAIPRGAVRAAAVQHAEYRGWTDPEPEDFAIAEDMLAAAERAWPHGPPEVTPAARGAGHKPHNLIEQEGTPDGAQ